MKHVIICGVDRCGKDSLIKGICEHLQFDNITIRHFSKPHKGHSDPLSYQKLAFKNEGELTNIDQFRCIFLEICI